MESYSAQTKVELTAKGWLYSANLALKIRERCVDKRQRVHLSHRAKKLIEMALAVVEPEATGVHQDHCQ